MQDCLKMKVLEVIVGFEETFIIEYQQLLSDGRYLFIRYNYKNKNLNQTIEISDSKSSLAYYLAGYNIRNKDSGEINLESYFKRAALWKNQIFT